MPNILYVKQQDGSYKIVSYEEKSISGKLDIVNKDLTKEQQLELQIVAGRDGTSGSSGVDGRDGKDGERGLMGRTGLTGPRGSNGIDGRNGTSGSSGIDGTSGTDGARGATGPAGKQGERGERGFPGQPAFITPPKYAIIYDTTTQPGLDGTFSQVVMLNTLVESNNISLVDGSKIKVEYTNVYDIQFSFQYTKSNAADANIDIWLRKNGIDVPFSNTKVTVVGQNQTHFVPAWNWMLKLNAGEYVEIVWHSDNTAVSLTTIPAQSNPTRPVTPSCIVTINQIAYAAPSGGI